ncbi:MAG TPA: SMC-Scp complex subunit ScpB [Candidatus Anaerostipes avicola]|uniref:SMC-Scp complex subunit ScpB n=1 Tax=Anaerostipes TaxID=207244 RepID=UPI001F9C3928|nr:MULTISPECIES: SMC-Scp complex subunit ScpB [Anaerostipes]HJC83457.1 SMC-Scp complex subunit ScpB [Candidatus Anaerostipes avicola]
MKEKQAMIEGILFSMGTSVSKKQLKTALNVDDDLLEYLIDQLKREYKRPERGIRLLEFDDSIQLCTKPEYYEALIRIVNHPKKPKLTDVMLETLSIIAYKQPVTKQEIEAIRGVKCDHPVNKLLEYNLICEAGRLDAVGRPILFKTTEEFLRCFGVSSVKDLPVVQEETIEGFKAEAQEEVKYALEEEAAEEMEEK